MSDRPLETRSATAPNDAGDLRSVRAILIDGYSGSTESQSATPLPETVWIHRKLGALAAVAGLIVALWWCWRGADQFRFTAFVDNPPSLAPSVLNPVSTPDLALILNAVAADTLAVQDLSSVSVDAKPAERSSELVRVELVIRASDYSSASQEADLAMSKVMEALAKNTQPSLDITKQFLTAKLKRVEQSLVAAEALIELASRANAPDRPALAIQAAQLRVEAALLQAQRDSLRAPQLKATSTFTGQGQPWTKSLLICAAATLAGAAAGVSLSWFWATMRATERNASVTRG
jgi:hypothetical protein